MKHFLYIQDKYYNDILSGIKDFEIRRKNRNYKIGDLLVLKNLTTGKIIEKEIKYISDCSVYNVEELLILGLKQ